MSDNELILPAQVSALPTPREVGQALKLALEERVVAARLARGDVHAPEDVNPLSRALLGTAEILADYGRAFNSAAAFAKRELGEELLNAVGEQDGIPLGNHTVPDVAGDIKLTRDNVNVHDIDLDPLIAAAAFDALTESSGTEPVQRADQGDSDYTIEYENWMAGVMTQAVYRLLTMGTFTAQVSKVRAYSADLARRGYDSVASTVSGAVRTTAEFRGVKVERKKEKP